MAAAFTIDFLQNKKIIPQKSSEACNKAFGKKVSYLEAIVRNEKEL